MFAEVMPELGIVPERYILLSCFQGRKFTVFSVICSEFTMCMFFSL